MVDSQNKILRASLLVALSGILYGFMGFLGTKSLQQNVSIPGMLFWRFSIASCWMFLFVAKGRIKNKLTYYFDKKVLFYTFLLGAIGYAGSSGFYFLACRYTGTGLAMVIFFSYPIMISLLTWIVHRKGFNIPTISVLVAITVGLFLLRNPSNLEHSVSLAGIIFGLLAAFSYALYVMGGKKFSSRLINSNLLTMMVCLGNAFLFLILAILTHSFVLPSMQTIGYLLVLGILVTAIPIQLMLEGLKQISSLRASIISVLEPLVTVLVGVALLHESISVTQSIGALLILSSAILVQFYKKL